MGGSSTSEAPRSDSGIWTTTSYGHYQTPASSDHFYTLICDEPNMLVGDTNKYGNTPNPASRRNSLSFEAPFKYMNVLPAADSTSEH